MSIYAIPISVAIAATALLAACDRESADKEPNVQSATSNEASRSALVQYEAVRASLAKDDIGSATTRAKSLESQARAAAATATGTSKQQWTELAKAAAHLSTLPQQDADEVRKAFGTVSQSLIALLAGDPKLAEGLFVFECPMAQGYKKWVQPAPKIENPYMGSKMLECGSKTSL